MTGALGERAPTRNADTTDVDDERLVAAARHDRRAFAPLYARYANPIYQYCYGRLGAREAAEDATSLVFAKALDALPRYRTGSFRSWLFTIAHNVVVDHHRSARGHATLETATEVIAPGPGPDELVLAADLDRGVRDLLQHLSADQRRVIELRLMGLSGPEIAEVLGRTHSWVKVAQFRAIARLRTRMGAGPEAGEVRHAAG